MTQIDHKKEADSTHDDVAPSSRSSMSAPRASARPGSPPVAIAQPDWDGFDWVFRECVRDTFVFSGSNLRFLQVSEGARNNLGYTNDALMKMTPVDIECDADAAGFRARLSPLGRGERETLEIVTEYRRADGTTYPVELHLRRLALGDDALYFGIAMDLTRGTATEQVINEAAAALHSSADAMVIVDGNGKIRVANESMASLLGYAPAELRGMEADALLPARLRATHSLHPRELGRHPKFGGLGAHLSLNALAKDGSELPVEICLNPVATRDGTLVAAAIRDLSGVERTRLALHESEERYRDLFENSSDVIQIMDTSGKLTYVNPAWRKALGFENSQARFMSVQDTMDEDQRALAQASFERLLADGSPEDVAWRLLSSNGEVLDFEGSVDCQRSNGQVIGFRAILHDVTRRNAHEEALRDGKSRAEQSAAIKSRFLAAAGHDLRQPLQSLGLYLAVLSRRVDDPLVHEIGRKMRVSVDSMTSLLDALLDISRFDAGMIVPRLRDFALANLLGRIVTDSVQQAERKGLSLSCRAGDYVVRSDPALLERIVENFVTNAIRYSDAGTIEIVCEEIEGNALRLSVRDNGIGIPEDQVSQIFDEYYQVGSGARERGRGLGLGLSIVKHIARLLDLRVHVSSSPGRGSVFSVDVPLGDADSLREAARRTRATRAANGAGRPVVLVVDDDASIVDAASMFLDVAGYKVSSAQNRAQVESILDTGVVPDVLVTDYCLPDANGVELVRSVRRELDRAVPAILITGDTSLSDIGDEELPDSIMMRKPVKTDALLALIERLLRQ